MPYKSEKQRRYMHAKHPEIARRWDREYGTSGIGPSKSRKSRPSRPPKRRKSK